MTDPAFLDDKPYHAHIYATFEERPRAEALRATFARETGILFVGCITEGKAGPHPIPQFEIHFCKSSLDRVLPMIEASGLRALVHPLTKDDLADHTRLAHWIADPIALDLTTLDPPGVNQGIARFGKSDF